MPRPVGTIEYELDSAKKKLDLELRRAAAVRAELAGYVQAVRERCAMRSNTLFVQFEQSAAESRDPSAFGWDHPIWEAYQPTDNGSVVDLVRLAGIVEDGLLDGENAVDLPATVPLFDSDGPIIIRHNGASQDQARNTLQSLVLRIALFMPGQVRFTLLDPSGMGAAYPYRGFLGREVVRNAGRSATDELLEVLDDIRRINERVIGQAPRFSSLSYEQRSGESFEIIAVADFPRAYAKDPRAVESLVKIANVGPRAGRHVIFEWNDDERLPHDFSLDQLAKPTIVDVNAAHLKVDVLPDGRMQKELVDRAFGGSRRREGGDWNAVVRPKQLMHDDASDRVLTPIGERLKFWLGESEEGKPSAHAMIAGQTGSGKSYFLHVLITGLAARYSPQELRFTLIDGKQGVEFEAYRNLSHVDVVCLRSAPALARSVLADFVIEMENRYEKFQEVGVVKLKDYRKRTGKPMPRRLLVVDEYQQILEGDPETGALLLGKLLEKGRAAGMHAVLGSQTFEQRGLPQAALTHIHTWASLSQSETYSQSLQVFGSEGKRLIRELAPSGEVVLNDEGGRDGANARGAVARLRKKSGEDLLEGIVSEICAAVNEPRSLIVLSGREGALVSDNPHVTTSRTTPPSPDDLQRLARASVRQGGFGMETWNQADRPIPLWFGRRFDVRGHVLCPLRRAPGQNLLILGNDTEARSRMLSVGLAASGALLAPDAIEVLLIDGLRDDMPGGGMLKAGLNRLAEAGVKVTWIGEDILEETLTELAGSIATAGPSSPSRLLVITEPDYLYPLQGGADRFSAPTSGPTVALRTILQRGPQAGLHTVLTASGLTSFQLVLSPGREAAFFNHRVVQQMNEEDSMSLFSSLLAARLTDRADHPYACLYIDQIAGARNGVLFNSYSASRALGGNQGIDALQSELRAIRYPGE